jgi:hypothetical protein
MVFGVLVMLEEWMEERLLVQAAAIAAAGDESGAMDYNELLGSLYVKQGRHDEAAILQEAVLKFRRGVLPENHPTIGAK